MVSSVNKELKKQLGKYSLTLSSILQYTVSADISSKNVSIYKTGTEKYKNMHF